MIGASFSKYKKERYLRCVRRLLCELNYGFRAMGEEVAFDVEYFGSIYERGDLGRGQV